MFRDGVINFLEATIVLLGVTNLFSIVVAGYAIALARGFGGAVSTPPAHALSARWTRMNRWIDGVQR